MRKTRSRSTVPSTAPERVSTMTNVSLEALRSDTRAAGKCGLPQTMAPSRARRSLPLAASCAARAIPTSPKYSLSTSVRGFS